MKDGWLFAGLISLLVILWVVIGGPTGSSNPPAEAEGSRFSLFGPSNRNDSDGANNSQQEDGDAPNIKDELDKIEEEVSALEQAINASIYKDIVRLKRGGASRTSADAEYVIVSLSSSAGTDVSITNWILESPMTGRRVRIGNGVKNFVSGSVNTELPIVLRPGEEASIASGRSPVGVSFRTNLCTGYLEQFQDFSPILPRECPLLEDHSGVQIGPFGFSDECLDYIDRVPRCQIVLDPPEGLGHQCYPFLNRENNYNECVNDHKNESDFLGDEWRVFLRQNGEIWKSKREVIKLFDQTGKLVDAITY